MSDRAARSIAAMAEPEIVAEIVRSGFVEGHHHGSVVALDPDGGVAWSVGAVEDDMFPRSCNKPLQAVALLRAGWTAPPESIALASASHSGESVHVDVVRAILAEAGLDESALQNPADYPLDDAVREQAVRAGQLRRPVLMNCSGKHAAMLATCVANGWDTATYLEPEHPLQVLIRDVVGELVERPIVRQGVDGCGAPLLATSLVGLARAFRRLALATEGPERDVAEAIRTHPLLVSGTRRDELALHRAVPGLIGKAGAESCYAVALPDGRAVALKIDDGAPRARPVVMAAALARLGLDADAVHATGRHPLYGGGAQVGEIRAAGALA